ncbi:MAG: hypothetical protein RLZZ546_405 [Bacteroidota bacterium]|jgi:hypothetical protein
MSEYDEMDGPWYKRNRKNRISRRLKRFREKCGNRKITKKIKSIIRSRPIKPYKILIESCKKK